MVKRMTSAKHSPKRIHSMKKNARPSSDRTADGDRDREIRLIVVDDAPRAASGEPAGVRATPVIIFLVVARGSSRSQIFIVRSSDRVVARGSEAPRAAKRRRRGWLTAERGAWVSSRISSRRWFGRTPESARNARRGEETREYPSRSEHAGEIDASRAQGSRWCWAEAATRRAPRPKRGDDREVRRRRVEKRGGKIKICLRSSPRLCRRKFPQKKRRGKMQNVRKRRRNRLLARLNERRLEQTRSGEATEHELA